MAQAWRRHGAGMGGRTCARMCIHFGPVCCTCMHALAHERPHVCTHVHPLWPSRLHQPSDSTHPPASSSLAMSVVCNHCGKVGEACKTAQERNEVSWTSLCMKFQGWTKAKGKWRCPLCTKTSCQPSQPQDKPSCWQPGHPVEEGWGLSFEKSDSPPAAAFPTMASAAAAFPTMAPGSGGIPYHGPGAQRRHWYKRRQTRPAAA